MPVSAVSPRDCINVEYGVLCQGYDSDMELEVLASCKRQGMYSNIHCPVLPLQ